MRKKFGFLLVFLCTFLLISGTSWALSIGFDDVNTQGGTVSYDGMGGPMVGTDIIFDQIKGDGTPLDDGNPHAIIGGLLNFTTGANISEGPTQWLFAGGGSFTLIGGIPDLGIAAGSVLLSGSFTGPNVVAGGAAFLTVGTIGIDAKHPRIEEWFGVTPPAGWTFAHTDISLLPVVGSTTGNKEISV